MSGNAIMTAPNIWTHLCTGSKIAIELMPTRIAIYLNRSAICLRLMAKVMTSTSKAAKINRRN